MSTIQIVVDAVTFIASVGSSAFIAGTRWGTIQSDLKTIGDRLSRIEGMFTLRLKDNDK